MYRIFQRTVGTRTMPSKRSSKTLSTDASANHQQQYPPRPLSEEEREHVLDKHKKTTEKATRKSQPKNTSQEAFVNSKKKKGLSTNYTNGTKITENYGGNRKKKKTLPFAVHEPSHKKRVHARAAVAPNKPVNDDGKDFRCYNQNTNNKNNNNYNRKPRSSSLMVGTSSVMCVPMKIEKDRTTTNTTTTDNNTTIFDCPPIAQLSPEERHAQRDFISHASYKTYVPTTTSKQKLQQQPRRPAKTQSLTSTGNSSSDTMITANTTSVKSAFTNATPTICSLSPRTIPPQTHLSDSSGIKYADPLLPVCNGDSDGHGTNVANSATIPRSNDILINVDGMAKLSAMDQYEQLSVVLQQQQLEYYRSQNNMGMPASTISTTSPSHSSNHSSHPPVSDDELLMMDALSTMLIEDKNCMNDVGITRTKRTRHHCRFLQIAILLCMIVGLAATLVFLLFRNIINDESSHNSSSYNKYQIGSDIQGGLQRNGDQKTGKAVAISKTGLIVAVAGEGKTRNENRGRVRIFEFQSSSSDNTESNNTIDINNENDNRKDNENDDNHDGDWRQLGQSIDGEYENDWLGASIDLSSDGHVIAIGVPKHNNATGYVIVMEYLEDTKEWKPLDRESNLPLSSAFDSSISSSDVGDWSGASVSLSGDGHIVAIGSPFHCQWVQAIDDDAVTRNIGQVRVYQYSSSSKSWQKMGQIMNGNKDNCFFGYSVSLSNNGERLAIGGSHCSTDDAKDIVNNKNNNSGDSVVTIVQYDFENTTYTTIYEGLWDIIGFIPANEELSIGNTHSFGSVSLSGDGDTVAYGNPHGDHGGDDEHDNAGDLMYDVGSVHVYGSPHDRPVSDHIIPDDNHDDEDRNTADLHKNLNIDGKKEEAEETSTPPPKFESIGSILWGETSKDFFGMDVALNDDGTTLLVGSPGNDHGPTRIMSGSAFLYDLYSRRNIWTPVESTRRRTAESSKRQRQRRPKENDNNDSGFHGVHSSDQFGYSVALSGDGSHFIAGAPFHTNEQDIEQWGGHARVFIHPHLFED